MLDVVDETPTARNFLSVIQIWDAVIKLSVNRSVIEDIDKKEVEIIDMEKNMNLNRAFKLSFFVL